MNKLRWTAHDVRRLRVCAACGGIDHLSRMVEVDGKLHHDHCAVSLLTEDQILALPSSERAKFSLGAVGSRLMRKLMEAAP